MQAMTDPILNHPEYNRAYVHYSQHGQSPEDAARLAYDHTRGLVQQPRKPRQPMSTKKALLVVAAVLASAVAFLALVAVIARMPGGEQDVEITSCDNGSASTFTAGVSVTNSTSTSKSYWIKVELVDASGNRVADARAYIADLAPGQTATDEAVGFTSGDGSTCQLVDVSRR